MVVGGRGKSDPCFSEAQMTKGLGAYPPGFYISEVDSEAILW